MKPTGVFGSYSIVFLAASCLVSSIVVVFVVVLVYSLFCFVVVSYDGFLTIPCWHLVIFDWKDPSCPYSPAAWPCWTPAPTHSAMPLVRRRHCVDCVSI
jgi:hypothetical protein